MAGSFRLTDDEVEGLRFHFETSKRPYRPSSASNQSSSIDLN
jgi:hypothetical protein